MAGIIEYRILIHPEKKLDMGAGKRKYKIRDKIIYRYLALSIPGVTLYYHAFNESGRFL